MSKENKINPAAELLAIVRKSRAGSSGDMRPFFDKIEKEYREAFESFGVLPKKIGVLPKKKGGAK